IVTGRCVLGLGPGNGQVPSGLLHAGDNRLLRCDRTYYERISLRPVAEYFNSIYTFPSMRVCIVYTLLSIGEGGLGTQDVLVHLIVILVVDAVAVGADHVIVCGCAFGLSGKYHSRVVSIHTNFLNHRCIWFFIFGLAFCGYSFGTNIISR